MTAYAEINELGEVLQQLGKADPEGFVGPDDPVPTDNPECTYEKLTVDINWRAKPSPTSKLMWLDGSPTWQETATLEELRSVKNLEINEARLKANRGSFTFMEKAVACDELSRSDIDAVNGIVSVTGALPDDWAGGWKCIDNSYITISDVTTWVAFYKAMVAQGTANFSHAQTLKANLAAATTPEEISLIKWSL